MSQLDEDALWRESRVVDLRHVERRDVSGEKPLVVVRLKDRAHASVERHEREPEDGGSQPVEEVLKAVARREPLRRFPYASDHGVAQWLS